MVNGGIWFTTWACAPTPAGQPSSNLTFLLVWVLSEPNIAIYFCSCVAPFVPLSKYIQGSKGQSKVFLFVCSSVVPFWVRRHLFLVLCPFSTLLPMPNLWSLPGFILSHHLYLGQQGPFAPHVWDCQIPLSWTSDSYEEKGHIKRQSPGRLSGSVG